MKPNLRLGYLVPQFPGQTHIFFWRELQELKRLGVCTTLISTSPPPRMAAHDWSADVAAQTNYLVRRDVAAALNLLRLPRLGAFLEAIREQPLSSIKSVLMAVPSARSLTRISKQFKLDHIHVHSCGRAALIAALARGMGAPPYSLTLHGPLEDYGPHQHFKWRHAAFATVITQKLLAESTAALGSAMPDAIEVQAMGVDTDRMSRTSAWQAPTSGETVRLFSCGRLNPVKGYLDLFEAVNILRTRGKLVRLFVGGEDDDGGQGYRQVLEDRIRALKLESVVTLLGSVSEEEVQRQLMSAHAFVLASLHEPLGVALMEAMSCEVPTIGTRSGGVPELITDGVDGILAQPSNPLMLADAISRVVDNPKMARRVALAGRARIVSKFSAEKSAQTLLRMASQVGR